MLDKVFKNNFFMIFIFLLISFMLSYTINSLEENEITKYKAEAYKDKVLESKVYLSTLIKEKENATATIALGLSRNSDIVEALKKSFINPNLLKDYSKRLRTNTDFKNVWFQLINLEGKSIQRSWTNYTDDKIVTARTDLKRVLRERILLNSISVGKFDMTFKAIVPVHDYDNKTFLGVVEVITHFNSIAKKLEKKRIDAIFIADKRYKKQLTKALSKTFIGDYYVANLDAKKTLIKYFNNYGMDKYLENVKNDQFYIDYDLSSIVSYHKIKNSVENKEVGYVLLIQSIDKIDISKIDYIKYIHNIYLLFSIIILMLIFYFFNTVQVRNLDGKSYSLKIFATIIVVYLILAFSIYKLVELKYAGDIESYKQTVINQTLLEYNSIIEKNKAISEFIFLELLNKENIKQMVQNNERKKLYDYLLDRYKSLKIKYNLRQLHFHLKDSTSFLRMHKPSKYGDSLVGVRESVEFVNDTLRPYYGFEEGRIYNGFRYVFPLINEEGVHIGSVEASFDIKNFIDNYMLLFETKRLNFLVSESIIKDKVFLDQQSNYLKSPVEGFYFDKGVIDNLESHDISINPKKATGETFSFVSQGIKKGTAFSMHFPNINELTVFIPLLNKITGEVVASLSVSKDDRFIQNRLQEFYQLIAVILIVLGFIMFFIYREFLSKMKARLESQNNQKILDSQNSFIVITNGKEIKRVNNTFLEFFAYKTIEEYKKEHQCICDFFVEEKGKNYILKDNNGLYWFDYLQTLDNTKRQVKIYDKQKNAHIFYIEFNPENKIYDNNFIVTFMDITHLKNIEDQLIYSEKMASLGNMIGNIAHQWRQPLSIISTSASGISVKQQFGMLKDEDIEKSMNYIVENTQYLSETIDTFRDFIKDSGDKEHKSVNIKESIESVLKILEASLHNHYINVEFNSENTENISKNMVKGEFTQVITNIINNAKDALIEREVKKPKIIITLLVHAGEIEITIEDNAGGVDDSIQDRIFEPYFTTKHQSMGTGLGLYICHKIIAESLKGKIDIENTKEGAKFSIQFPM